MTRTELLSLYTASKTAYAKFGRNAKKLAWMDATRRMGDVVIHCGPQLEAYRADWQAASAKFRAALKEMNWSTEQVLEFIEETGA